MDAAKQCVTRHLTVMQDGCNASVMQAQTSSHDADRAGLPSHSAGAIQRQPGHVSCRRYYGSRTITSSVLCCKKSIMWRMRCFNSIVFTACDPATVLT